MFGSKTTVGVDLGSSSVKVAQLRRAGNGFELEKVGSAAIYPDGERPADANAQRQAKVAAVKRALADAGITAKTSVSAVSGESIIVRYLQLPEMPEDELKKALQWEAEEYIPFRLDEVNLDSMVLGKSISAPDRVDVLLVSAKKDLVENHLSIIRDAGLTPKVVEVDSFAFLNCYETNYETSDECAVLINIGAEITGISIYHKGVSRFSRDIPVGGQTMTQAVRSHMRCSFNEAESLKISRGLRSPSEAAKTETRNLSGGLMDTIRGTVEQMGGKKEEATGDEAVHRALEGVVRDLINEVRRSVEFFENQMRDINVAKIVLGGGSATLPNLREHFEREFSLPVEIFDPLRRIRTAGRDIQSGKLDPVRHGLGVGIGLGIRGLLAA